ncbi:MAG: threonine synthase [Xanthomonadaceae bacterium]|nr:threonine synthase [Xanthomonadaceae bacterium]
MKYISTRGGAEPKSFCDVVLEGLCVDGGLSMPETIPSIDGETLQAWSSLRYADLAFEIASLYCTDIPADDLKGLMDRAYNKENFGTDSIITNKSIGGEVRVLEISNGPTFAFKDMAMQFLGELFPYVLERENKTLNILGATSGDTGSSAIHAMKGKNRINVFMLSPFERMSAFQTAQMYSVQDENIFNIAVKGVFDDCQDLVKALNNDANFKADNKLGAVNSINFARILAQIIYYFRGYFMNAESIGEPVDFVIPSGNFGNIFAGIMARHMGLPIRKLILATNENNVLDEFFKTGIYKPRASKEVHLTSSPSMDIAKASNFERFIYLIAGAEKTKALWDAIDEQGYFDLTYDALWEDRAAWNIESGESDHENRLETIRRIYKDSGELIDPHTADGVYVGAQYLDGTTQVCLETAKPIKFYETIKTAIPNAPFDLSLVEAIESLPQRFKVLDNSIEDLKAYMTTELTK